METGRRALKRVSGGQWIISQRICNLNRAAGCCSLMLTGRFCEKLGFSTKNISVIVSTCRDKGQKGRVRGDVCALFQSMAQGIEIDREADIPGSQGLFSAEVRRVQPREPAVKKQEHKGESDEDSRNRRRRLHRLECR
jgi:hypothetical protein